MTFGKLYGFKENPRTIPHIILAKSAGLDVELVFESPVVGFSQEYLKDFPKAKIPGFKGSDGYILTETIAIAIYFASQNENTTLLGKTKKEYALILQWMSYANSDLIQSLAKWVIPFVRKTTYVKETVDKAKIETADHCAYINNFLKTRTFFVGECLTLADLFMASVLGLGFSFVFGKEWRTNYSNLTRWYVTVTNQPIWTDALPTPALIDEPIVKYPEDDVKESDSEPKSACEIKSPPSTSLEEPSTEKKTKHSFDAISSSFVMDEWKRKYSNSSATDAMKWFWENLDSNAYSLWRIDYKYNDELGLVFQSSNLCGGFFQRLEASRKHLFGTLIVYGTNHDSMISGVFLVRGKDYKPVFEVAPDWESYTFTLLDHTKSCDRKIVECAWNWENPIEFNGKTYPVADGKVFK